MNFNLKLCYLPAQGVEENGLQKSKINIIAFKSIFSIDATICLTII